MQQRDGLFITIEGTDGSGKDTQAAFLKQRLETTGYEVVQFNFPQHGQSAAYFVDQYVHGSYGSGIQVGAYTACLFYALDYYDATPAIRKALAEGKAVIATRFGGSNMANQGAKIIHPEERRGFFIWLDNLQFRMLNMPRPTMSFVLRVPPAIAQERVRQKRGTTPEQYIEALQLAELDQLQLAATVYDDMCQLFPKDFIRVDCARGNVLLDPSQIHDLIWGKVSPLVPEPEPAPEVATPPAPTEQAAPQQSKTKKVSVLAAVRSGVPRAVISIDQPPVAFYIPPHLDVPTKELYEQHMSQLIKLYAKIADQLPAETRSHAQLVLPAAALVAVQHDQAMSELTPEKKPVAAASLSAVAAELQKNYSDESETVSLTSYWPRNELDVVPAILYEYSNQSFGDIQRTVSDWPYDKKSFVLRSYVREPAPNKLALDSVLYSWDVLTEFEAIADLRAEAVNSLDWQPLSPRLGYDVPASIEQAGLSEDFERCFDLSLKLYSTMQTAGYSVEAQYATLFGHRVRAKVTASASDLVRLYKLTDSSTLHPTAHRLITVLLSTLDNVHPLLIAAIRPAQADATPALAKPVVSAPHPKRSAKRANTKPPLDK